MTAKTGTFPLILMLLISLTPLVFVEIPRFLAFWPLIIGVTTGGWFLLGSKEKIILPRAYIICAGTICALLLTSCLWSIAPENAIKDALKIAAILGFGLLWIGLCNSVNTKDIQPYLYFIPVLFTLSCLLILMEVSLNMPIYSIIHGIPPGKSANPSDMNRGMVCIIIFYFIAMSFTRNDIFSIKIVKNGLYAVATVSLLMTLVISQSQSAQIAFLIGIIVFFGFPTTYKKAYSLVAFFIAAMIALAPFLVDILYDFLVGYGQQMPWLSDAYAGNRAEIWHFVTLYAMHNPLYGYGMEATRYVEHFNHSQIYHKSYTVLHPHNFAIQIWMEFGAVGVLVFSGLIYKLFMSVEQSTQTSIKPIMATIISIILVSSVAYGMWQSWWIGYIIFISGVAIILNRSMFTSFAIDKNEISAPSRPMQTLHIDHDKKA